MVLVRGTCRRGDAVFQSAQTSPGAARTVLLLTTFLWLSSVTWIFTPHLPREDLGTPAASLFSARVPHSGPNTLFAPASISAIGSQHKIQSHSYILHCCPSHSRPTVAPFAVTVPLALVPAAPPSPDLYAIVGVLSPPGRAARHRYLPDYGKLNYSITPR
jgi:hypothetical protein